MIKDYLFRILRPKFWRQNYPTCDLLSAAIEREIDSKSPVSIIDCYTAKLANMELWIGNYPYAYGYLRNPEIKDLPSARVRAKLKKYITEAVLKETTND